MPVPQPLYVTGHRGLVGSAIWRQARAAGVEVVGRTREELDLGMREDVARQIGDMAPGAIVLASGRVGSVLANVDRPADFIQDNLQIQINVLDSAVRHAVPRLLFLGSSAMYPQHAPQPLSELMMMSGPVEPAHSAYAVAKIAGMTQVQAIRRQHGLGYITAVPTNLYGPNDDFDLATAHVVPAMIRRFHEAKLAEDRYVTLWGTGLPRREFLHADDLAAAALFLLEHYDDPAPINVGAGEDVTVGELAALVKQVVGFEGRVVWDTSKPDGVSRRRLDSRNLNALGWTPSISLEDGIRRTYDWYVGEETSAGAATA